MDRLWKIIFFVSVLGLSWLGMMAAHELGHCMAARLSGGVVKEVYLHPLAISRTGLSLNPHPLFVAWGGAIGGTAFPFLLFLALRKTHPGISRLLRFFAGFCLIVNGLYMAEDAIFRAGDGGDLVRHGSPAASLAAFGIAAILLGGFLWCGLYLPPGISRRTALAALGALALAAALEILLGVG